MAKHPSILDIRRRRAGGAAEQTESLHVFVRRQLLNQLAHQWTAGTRLPPIREIASQYGVAIGTVQSAVRDLVRAGVLTSRPYVGTVVAPTCHPDRIRALLTEGKFEKPGSRSSLAGKVVRMAYVAEADRLIDDIAKQVVLSLSKFGFDLIEERCTTLVPTNLHLPDAEAVIAIQPPHHFEPRLEPHQTLLVVSTDRIAVNAVGRFDLVTVDDDHGSYLAGRRLKQAGCGRACFIGVRESRQSPTALAPTSLRRLHGFERGWGEAIPAERLLIARSYNIDPGEQVVSKFLDLSPRPDAIFAATDELAVGFIQGLRNHGLEPGRDVHVIGFDKQELALGLPGGPLTTIEVPRMQMAVRGAQTLVERLTDPDQPVRCVLLGCSLFEGTTAGQA